MITNTLTHDHDMLFLLCASLFYICPLFFDGCPCAFSDANLQTHLHRCSSAGSLQLGESGSLFRQVSGYVHAIVAASITVMQKFIIPFITAYKLLAVQHTQTAVDKDSGILDGKKILQGQEFGTSVM